MVTSIGQHLKPFTGYGNVSISEKLSSGTTNPKQTNTLFDRLIMDTENVSSLIWCDPFELYLYIL